MRTKRVLALILSCAMLLVMIPYTESYAAEQTNVEDDSAIHITTQAASQGWLPTPTRTVTSAEEFPLHLSSNVVVLLKGPIEYTAGDMGSAIYLENGAKSDINKVALIIDGSVTLRGGNAKDARAAGAAIHVPEYAELTIYSAHDEELANFAEAPKDTLTVIGGDAAPGSNGGGANRNAAVKTTPSATITTYTWFNGCGGSGGGGAAAAIGGNGGAGGKGGDASKTVGKKGGPIEVVVTVGALSGTDWDIDETDDNPGYAGNTGTVGSIGEKAGTVKILGRLTLNATGGKAAAGGNGGEGCEGMRGTNNEDHMIGGNGGGGGGGGGCAAPAIGNGGSGGSGGGSGGHLSSDKKGDITGCGGGGGAGGWPNGGGGGGGATVTSNADDLNLGQNIGGKGGAGGAAGNRGSSGNDGGTTSATKGNKAQGGAGGGGLSGNQASGGNGGTRRKDTSEYPGGKGGNGGDPTASSQWSAGSLLLSTANKLELSSSLGYAYGDGQGKGAYQAITPGIVYDMMDCAISVQDQIYTGSKISPSVESITVSYSAASDRDGVAVGSDVSVKKTDQGGWARLLPKDGNIHCPTGTVGIIGNRGTVNRDKAGAGDTVGVKWQEFTILKAKLTKVNFSASPTEIGDPENGSMPDKSYLYLENYYESTAVGDTGKQSLNAVWRDASGTTGWPAISWYSAGGTCYNSSSDPDNPDKPYFASQNGGEHTIQVTLSGMNDFEDYTSEPLSVTVKQSIGGTLNLTNAHPRQDTLTVSGILEDAATVTWYCDDIVIATGTSYALTNADAGKTLTVKITPAEGSSYMPKILTAAVEAHSYDNGFCQVCGEFEQPVLIGGRYQIDNGGKMFWFAAWVNGAATYAEAADEAHKDANATLTKDISLQNPADTVNGQSTEWTPIGVASGDGIDANDIRYIGTFDGQYHTISDLSITTVGARTGLFAAIDAGSTVKNFAVQGNITLAVGNTRNGNNAGVGGAVGCAFGGTVSGVTSRVNISNPGGETLSHVGGVVGGTNNGGVLITRCVYESGSTINVTNSTDCIGGVVGYANSRTVITYCANRGEVYAAAKDAYTGGVLGYLNKTNVTVKNCYNYGTVQNGGGNYCGAIVGCLMKGSANLTGKLTDNYYLEGSAPAGFGIGSKGTGVIAEARDDSAFTSGEVSYLVNGKTSTDDGAVWKQNVDNGKEPYDTYPVFNADTVYSLSDGNYSNYPERISVTITWGAMAFQYNPGHWDADTHTSTGAWECETPGGNSLTVQNDSNVALYASLKFTAAREFEEYNLKGSFSGVDAGKNLMERGGSLSANLLLQSLNPIKLKGGNTKKLGEIAVRFETIGGGN